MQFHELGVEPSIHRALTALGYQTPSPIQEGAIPPALAGRDILGLAQTGTGKTCAFAVPILQYLQKHPIKGNRPPRALIVTPTRELALQIDESFAQYGKNLNFIKHTVIFGGVGQNPQVQALRRSVDVLTATPGRLLDLHGQGHLDLTGIEILVLDEADRMLDMGFFPDVKRILKELPHEKQTMLFSATMPAEVSEVANSLLRDPVTVQVDPVSSTVDAIEQALYYVDKGNKSKLLAHIIKTNGVKNALVFTRTKHGANKVAADLEKAGIPAAAIHGNKSQTARVAALNAFKSGEVKALVATDIAARGIDIDRLSHVFNYNLPEVPETYVHRIGRTGRAGKDGTAVSFCDVDEKVYLKDVQKLVGFPIPVVEDHPFPMQHTTPTPTKNGRRVNPDDEEARQAARERRRLKQQAEQAGKNTGSDAPAKQAVSGKSTGAKSGRNAGKQSQSGRGVSPSQSRRTESAAKTPAPNTQGQKPTAPAPESGRRLSNNFVSKPPALEGDKIMDATARLLAPKKTLEYGKNTNTRPETERKQSRETAPSTEKPTGQASKNQRKPANKPVEPAANSSRQTTGKTKPNSGKPSGAPKSQNPQPSQKSQPKQGNSPKSNGAQLTTPTRVVGKNRPNRPSNRPPRAPEMPKSEHSEDFKPFYISFDD